MLYAEQPIEIESGGIHQVKPWFAGRLDFAPRLAFEGDADFSLAGGSVAYFIDRKAAVFILKHRLHVITLSSSAPTACPGAGLVTWAGRYQSPATVAERVDTPIAAGRRARDLGISRAFGRCFRPRNAEFGIGAICHY
jgi:anti-sigma factor RsiW